MVDGEGGEPERHPAAVTASPPENQTGAVHERARWSHPWETPGASAPARLERVNGRYPAWAERQYRREMGSLRRLRWEIPILAVPACLGFWLSSGAFAALGVIGFAALWWVNHARARNMKKAYETGELLDWYGLGPALPPARVIEARRHAGRREE